jgi:hypothetical protein
MAAAVMIAAVSAIGTTSAVFTAAMIAAAVASAVLFAAMTAATGGFTFAGRTGSVVIGKILVIFGICAGHAAMMHRPGDAVERAHAAAV